MYLQAAGRAERRGTQEGRKPPISHTIHIEEEDITIPKKTADVHWASKATDDLLPPYVIFLIDRIRDSSPNPTLPPGCNYSGPPSERLVLDKQLCMLRHTLLPPYGVGLDLLRGQPVCFGLHLHVLSQTLYRQVL